MQPEVLFRALVAIVPGAPLLAFMALGLRWLLFDAPSEAFVRRLFGAMLSVSLGASLAVAIAIFAGLHPSGVIVFGSWFGYGDDTFEIALRIDRLAVSMMVLVSGVNALIGRFSFRYLHRQMGLPRFFALLALFAAGMHLLVMGEGLDQLFVGWELVGLTSAFLIGYFHERRAPVENALRAFIVYRFCDLGLLAGAVLLHQVSGTTDMVDTTHPIDTHAHLGGVAVTLVPLGLLVAAMGKSAQFPFGAWLPRAMEGPTPSSAIFYGSLSVHAGVYLLIRAEPLIAAAPVAAAAVFTVGAITALYAGLVGRVQTDAKSALAYATMAQVGLMFVAIGLGLTTLATVHLFAHALLRGFQLLRAPSVLGDAQSRASAGVRAPLAPAWARVLPTSWSNAIYVLALERFHLDAIHERFVAGPVLALSTSLDRIERRWVSSLGGFSSPTADTIRAPADELERHRLPERR